MQTDGQGMRSDCARPEEIPVSNSASCFKADARSAPVHDRPLLRVPHLRGRAGHRSGRRPAAVLQWRGQPQTGPKSLRRGLSAPARRRSEPRIGTAGPSQDFSRTARSGRAADILFPWRVSARRTRLSLTRRQWGPSGTSRSGRRQCGTRDQPTRRFPFFSGRLSRRRASRASLGPSQARGVRRSPFL